MKSLFISILMIIPFISVLPQELNTDRPQKTRSSSTVPVHALQWETGFSFESDKAEYRGEVNYYRNLGINHSLLRFGLWERVELRIGADLLRKTVESEAESTLVQEDTGFEPVYFGTKIKIIEEKGLIPRLAVLAHVVIPSVPKLGDDDKLMPDLMLAGNFDPAEWTSIGFNLGFRWPDFTFEQVNFFYSFVAGFSHSEKIHSFWELYGFRDYYYAVDDVRFDAGMKYLLKENFQLDVSAGLGITEISPDYFISIGFSWRILE